MKIRCLTKDCQFQEKGHCKAAHVDIVMQTDCPKPVCFRYWKIDEKMKKKEKK